MDNQTWQAEHFMQLLFFLTSHTDSPLRENWLIALSYKTLDEPLEIMLNSTIQKSFHMGFAIPKSCYASIIQYTGGQINILQKKKMKKCIERSTGVRVLCSLKLSSRKEDCSFVSLSFFLPLSLLLLMESFSLFGNSSSLSIFLKLDLSFLLMASCFGRSANVKSKQTTGFSF